MTDSMEHYDYIWEAADKLANPELVNEITESSVVGSKIYHGGEHIATLSSGRGPSKLSHVSGAVHASRFDDEEYAARVAADFHEAYKSGDYKHLDARAMSSDRSREGWHIKDIRGEGK